MHMQQHLWLKGTLLGEAALPLSFLYCLSHWGSTLEGKNLIPQD